LQIQGKRKVKLDVVPVAQDAADYSFKDTAVVVIDALRASTSIQVILEGGGRRVYPVASVEEARAQKRRMSSALLCGERHGYPPEGFDMGNSPAEFARTDLRGRDVILTTTNGTLAISHASEAKYLFSACILNSTAVATTILDCREIERAVFVCAGTDGAFSIEDFYVAGLTGSIIAKQEGWDLTDIAWAAAKLSENPIRSTVNERTCAHLKTLIEKGFAADVAYALGDNIKEKSPNGKTIVPAYSRDLGCFSL